MDTDQTLAVALTNEFDLSDVNHEAKIKELHEQLEDLMLRRLKRDVLNDLPPHPYPHPTIGPTRVASTNN